MTLYLQYPVPKEIQRPRRDALRADPGILRKPSGGVPEAAGTRGKRVRAMRNAIFIVGDGPLYTGNVLRGRGGGTVPVQWALKAIAGSRDVRFVDEAGTSAHCCGCFGRLKEATHTVCASTAGCEHRGRSGGGCFGGTGVNRCPSKTVPNRMSLFCPNRACRRFTPA